MKIFLYNKYLLTGGGGEKHSGRIAEVLARTHDVTILHLGEGDINKISAKLNIDLTKVHFKSFGYNHDIDFEIIQYVKDQKPDVFINATYFSKLLTNAPKNVSLIFFPKYYLLKKPSLKDKLKFNIGNLLFKEYHNTIRFHEGFYNEEIINKKVGRWTSEHSTILINKPFRKLTLYYTNPDKKVINDTIKTVKIHGHRLNFYLSKNKIEFNNIADSECGVHLLFNTLKPSENNNNNLDGRDLGVFITQINTDALNSFSRIIIRLWQTQLFGFILSRIYVKWTVLQHFNYYKRFLSSSLNIANSNYTRRWIEKLYGNTKIDIELLYPPVDIENFINERKKEKVIICVGRFFVDGHNKKQLELIKAFKKMYDNYKEAREYKLFICGGTHPEKQHRNYLALCQLSSQGYPISIYPDIEFKRLIKYYSQAKIFWHAAGMHEDESLTPDKFEHFGITTVEAMAAGCIPVVIGVAGQKEIVSHLNNGLLWNTESQLITNTIQLINDEKLCQQLATQAVERAKEFNKVNFDTCVHKIFEKIKSA